MKPVLALILALIAVNSWSGDNTQQVKSLKDEYELQEKCGKRTEEVFRKEWGDGIHSEKDLSMTASYTNHYNKKLNKCFYLLTSNTLSSKSKNKTSYQFTSLWDINDNKEYGELINDGVRINCHVQEVKCYSTEEWESLIKSYISD